MLVAHNLECIRNEQVLFSQLHFTVAEGEILHLVGPNGCGKSSLLHILLSLLLPQQGEVLWRGKSIFKDALDYRSQIAYVGHKIAVKAGLTVLENLYMAEKLGASDLHLNWSGILKHFALEEIKHTLSQHLSAGQRQRVALTRLLISKASLWILDEPFTSMDHDSVATLQSLLLEHVARGGMVILTSHQSFELAGMAIKKLDL